MIDAVFYLALTGAFVSAMTACYAMVVVGEGMPLPKWPNMFRPTGIEIDRMVWQPACPPRLRRHYILLLSAGSALFASLAVICRVAGLTPQAIVAAIIALAILAYLAWRWSKARRQPVPPANVHD
jgi:hypothetical protein